MLKRFLALFLWAALPAAAQTLYVYPTANTVPRGTQTTVTAIVTGSANKGVTWTQDGGTNASIVGTNPCNNPTEPCTASLYSTVAGTYHLTATSNANGAITAVSTITVTASPTHATTHPRFIVTPGNLAAYQAKAVVGNPMWNNALYNQAQAWYAQDSGVRWNFSTWSGSACTGGSYIGADYTAPYEDHAWTFTLVSMFGPDATTRQKYGCAAHDVFMWLATNYIQGGVDLTQGNRWADGAREFGFIPDYLMGGGYLTSSEIATMRIYLAKLEYDQIENIFNGTQAQIGGYNAPSQFVGADQAAATAARALGNNYTQARILLMIAGALTFNDDTTDDPPMPTTIVRVTVHCDSTCHGGTGWNVGDQFTIAGGSGGIGTVQTLHDGTTVISQLNGGGGSGYTAGTNISTTPISPATGTGLTVDIVAQNSCIATRYQVCTDGTAGSLHAYLPYVTGGLMYKDWAAMENPAVVQSAYNTTFGNMATAPTCNTYWSVAIPCLGINRGGESAEGTDYGNSLSSLRYGLTALYTAGWDNPLACLQTDGSTAACPQLSLGHSSYWDLRYVADLHLLAGLTALNGESSRWYRISNGDSNAVYASPSGYQSESSMLALDSILGRTDRSNALEWIVLNTAFGMADGTVGSCSTSCGFVNDIANDYGSRVVYDTYMALPAANPVTTSPPTDPRPSTPTEWYDAGNKHLSLRTGWTSTDSQFSYYCPDTQIDHEHGMCGGFSVWAGGEMLTGPRQEFDDYNPWATVAYNTNTLSIWNSTGTGIDFTIYPWGPTIAAGGQSWHGYQTGLMPLYHAESTSYAAMVADMKNGYNNTLYTGFSDINAASESMVYLRGTNQIAYYDRAGVGHSASTQSLHLNTTGTATVTGNQAVWSSRTATHKAAFTSLLPSGATITHPGLFNQVATTAPFSSIHLGNTMQLTCTSTLADGTTNNCISTAAPTTGLVAQWSVDNSSIVSVSSTGLLTALALGSTTVHASYGYPGHGAGVSDLNITVTSGSSSGSASGQSENVIADWWQPSQNITVTPAGTPLSSQFLSVFEWGASTLTPATPTLVQSASGDNFDGAKVGSSLVMFMRSWPGSLTGTTFPASGATTVYVSDLSPNTSYGITGTGTPGTATSDNAGVITFAAAGTGNITVGAATPPPSHPAIGVGVGLGVGVVIQ